MRILVVTSQFPIAGEPTRGRPIHQTVRELGKLADVRVASPVAVYPRWAQPRSYLYRPPEKLALDCDVEYVSYPALPAVSRPFNGWLSGRAIDAEVVRFKPDVVLAYWLYPDAFGAMCAAPTFAYATRSVARSRDASCARPTVCSSSARISAALPLPNTAPIPGALARSRTAAMRTCSTSAIVAERARPSASRPTRR
jgi:hypothetical protein